MAKLYAQMTDRERLIELAAGELRRAKREGAELDPRLALEAALDSCWSLPATTYGGRMARYYRDATERQRELLDSAVKRAAN